MEEEGGPGPEGFSDAAAADSGGARGGEEAPPPALAPALCWQPAQLAADLALAKQLARAADKEKGVAGNPLLPAAAGGGGGEAQEGEAAAAAEGGADMDAELSPEETAAKLDQVSTGLIGCWAAAWQAASWARLWPALGFWLRRQSTAAPGGAGRRRHPALPPRRTPALSSP